MRHLKLALLTLLSLPSVTSAQIITGTGSGTAAHVKVFSDAAGTNTASFLPYGAFTGGVRVGSGAITPDSVPEIITGTGPGAPGGHVKAFDGDTLAEIRSFLAYSTGFAGGIYVAGGNITSDGVSDIVTGAGEPSGNGHVKVFDGVTGAEVRSFLAYAGFGGGVRVAAGDLTGDGIADIFTGAGPGGVGGHVKVFDGVTNDLVRSFFAYPTAFAGGIFVAAGDVNGDGRADIITGTDEGTVSHVKVFDAITNLEIHSFLAYGAFTGGVRVASAYINDDIFADIITGTGPGAPGGHVKVFDGQSLAELGSFFAYDPGFSGGIYVAGARSTPSVVVPEPGSAALLMLGGLSMMFLRLRRR